VERVKAYVDGFNLYHGLKARHGRKYLWLDLHALAVRLLKPSQHLVAVEYFTARVRNQPESEQRQTAYLDALAAHCPLVKVVQGRFQEKTHECWSCGGRWVSYEEKETDVSIAVQLVEDGVQGVFDTALRSPRTAICAPPCEASSGSALASASSPCSHPGDTARTCGRPPTA
jgi:hypothetical protein